jgi:DnaK suppressor protein
MTRTQLIRETRDRLVRRRSALRQAIAGDQRLLHSLHEMSVGDEIDAALATEQAELRSQMAEVESRELAQIDLALEKIRAGRYGRCESCEKAISPVRLKHLPYATECINCARREERREAAPGRGNPVNRIARFAGEESDSHEDFRVEIS